MLTWVMMKVIHMYIRHFGRHSRRKLLNFKKLIQAKTNDFQSINLIGLYFAFLQRQADRVQKVNGFWEKMPYLSNTEFRYFSFFTCQRNSKTVSKSMWSTYKTHVESHMYFIDLHWVILTIEHHVTILRQAF